MNKKIVIDRYDEDTGEPIKYIYFKCPNRKWYFSKHSKFRTDLRGETPKEDYYINEKES